MATQRFPLSDDQKNYFTDVDNSIMRHSVELGKLQLQADSVKDSLGTMYAARMKRLNTVVAELGADPQKCVSVRVERGELVIQTSEDPLST